MIAEQLFRVEIVERRRDVVRFDFGNPQLSIEFRAECTWETGQSSQCEARVAEKVSTVDSCHERLLGVRSE